LEMPLSEKEVVEILKQNLRPEVRHSILNLQVRSVEKWREICRRREDFLEDVRMNQATKGLFHLGNKSLNWSRRSSGKMPRNFPMPISVGKSGQWRLFALTAIKKDTDNKIVSLREKFSVCLSPIKITNFQYVGLL